MVNQHPLHQLQQDRLDLRSLASATINTEPSRTLQGPAEEADINRIMRDYAGKMPPLPPQATDPAYYGDFSQVPDLQEALSRINDAKSRFAALPSRLREEFDNDPAQLWAFVNDPQNADKAVEMGLLARAPQPGQPPTTENPPSPTPTT